MQRIFNVFRTTHIRTVRRCFADDSFGRDTKKTALREQLTKQFAKHDGRYMVTMIIGAGLGPELMCYVQDLFCHVGVPVDFEVIEANSMKDIEDAVASIQKNGAGIVSTIQSFKKEDGTSVEPNLYIRQSLNLYLNMTRYKPYCNLANAKHADVDVILMRQNTEGEYSLLEHESVKGVVESIKVITRANSALMARRTFDYASVHGRKKVTVVTKANIMKLSDGLFLEEARKVAKEYPDIKHNDILIDNCCMQMVSNPKQFDTLMMPNLYGSIVGNIMSGLLGGPGLFAGGNYGEKCAVFEPAARKRGKHLSGKNAANPVAMMNAAVELLFHLGLSDTAHVIEKAIYKTLCEDHIHTPDLHGTNCSTDVLEYIKDNVDLFQSQGKST